MKLRLTPTAERLLDALPEGEWARVAAAFDLLEGFPLLGKAYAPDSPFAEKEARYFIVRVGRRRSLRITYRLIDDTIVVLYLFPATYPLTHPEHLKLYRGDE